MSIGDAAITLRLWWTAALVRSLKRIIPLDTLVRLAHRKPSGRERSAAFEKRLEGCMTRVGRFPLRPPANCLERSLGAYRMLCAASSAPELVIGVRRVPGQGVQGHVWVAVAGRPLAERHDELATYAVIAKFDANARRSPSATSATELAGIPLR